MKRLSKFFLAATAALVAAACVQKETKRKQRNACKEGRHVPYGPYEAVLKRPLDILITGMALVPLAPVMGITALFVKKKLGSPVIFKQARPGKDEKIFTLYKFRTMTDETDKNGELLPDEKRLTGFGKWLRSTSLDELPELFNILRGDMSLVGPRPLVVEYLPYYTKEERHRHDVRPGLTGLAQVSGRSFLSWEQIFEYDQKYIAGISFIHDLRIIFSTAVKVLERKNVADVSQATLGEDGRLHVYKEEESVPLHNPLNVERKEHGAERDRQ